MLSKDQNPFVIDKFESRERVNVPSTAGLVFWYYVLEGLISVEINVLDDVFCYLSGFNAGSTLVILLVSV